MSREGLALSRRKAHLARLGAGFLGIVGDKNHGYGFHLAVKDLKAPDYSSTGSRNVVGPRDAACAMDTRVTKVSRDVLGNPVAGWPAARAYLRWRQVERKAKRDVKTAELIGSLDGKKASYAADSTGWDWEPYQGSGHVDWQHEAVYRKYADDPTFHAETFGKWGPRGLLLPPPKPKPPAPKPQTEAQRSAAWLARWPWSKWGPRYSATLLGLIPRVSKVEADMAALQTQVQELTKRGTP